MAVGVFILIFFNLLCYNEEMPYTVLIDAELSVVSATIIKRCLAQLHYDVGGRGPIRRINVRACRPPVLQKNERRSVDWTMRWPARVKSGAFV